MLSGSRTLLGWSHEMGVLEWDLAGKDVDECQAAELVGEVTALGLAVPELALPLRCASLSDNRLAA